MNKFELAQTFLTIADNGSIQAAATKLSQSEAAVSKKLKKLEEWLEVQLIIRKRTGLVLTEAGQNYYQASKKAIEQFLEAEAGFRQKKNIPQGLLNVVSNEYYFRHFILPHLAGYSKKYPKIMLNINIAEILPNFQNKPVDIVFGGSATGTDNMVRKKIHETRYVLCAAPQYFKKHGTPRATAELLQHQFIAHASRNPPNIITLDNDERIILTPALMMNNTSMIIEACLKNLGFIWTHENLVEAHLKNKTLVRFLDKFTQKTWSVYAYYEYQSFINPSIKVFMDYFCSQEMLLLQR
ncbi:MAG: LysR family transcriptional regulator [Gammaproteobacteria bacterium]|nr:LysR family transcriptional regulator [Gammaproteobacteria bacterium]